VDFSVIICTHNPRPAYLHRVLEALRAQTVPMTEWELLLVDNASKERLAEGWDLSWHPQARHLREEKLGVVHARSRALRESRGDILVFVDDDNVLAENYLAAAAALLRERPDLGVLGTGLSVGEFEVPPPKSIEYYLPGLVVWDMKRDYWTNFGGYTPGMPVGAGMCVRREVAELHLSRVEGDPWRQKLGRSGLGMGAGEDQDLCFTAHGLGLGTGRFMALKLVHLIPKERLTEDYVARLLAGFEWTEEIIYFIRHGTLRPAAPALVRRLRHLYKMCTLRGFARRVYVQEERARQDARRLLTTPDGLGAGEVARP
jgi:glycosyltransferase involved in cell wall biosynthesis